MRALLRAALVLLAAAAAARPARGGPPDEATSVPARAGFDEGPVIRVATSYGASGSPAGGWGWIRLDVHNEDDRPHVFGARLRTFSGQQLSISRSARLGPGEGARIFLPQPAMAWGQQLAFLVDGGVRHTGGGWASSAVAVVVVSSEEAWSARATSALGTTAKAASRRDVQIEAVAAADLPDRWTFLSGVALLVLDGRARGLDAGRQRAILDYARGGGSLLVLGRGAIPAGPLADALAGMDGDALGLGYAWAFDDQDLGGAGPKATIDRWGTRLGGLASSGAPLPGLLPPGFLGRLEVPGLGRVPVRLFFFVILAFAVLVGPVTYLALRRRRRLPYLVAIVPAAGLVFTVGILAYGFLSEGLGTKGVARSLTLLDQARHEGIATAGRTLYAGLSPSALVPSPDTFLHSTDFVGDDPFDAGDSTAFQWDLDTGRIGGGALPSRTPTAFGTVTLARMRERVRVRKADGGRWEALADAAFPPLPEAASVVLHAPDGSWHVGDGTGPLAPASAGAAREALEKRAAWLADMPLAPEPEESRVWRRSWRVAATPAVRDAPDAVGGREWIASRLRAAMRPGTCLVASERAPSFDDLGLEVRWVAGRHLVLAGLGPEDVDE